MYAEITTSVIVLNKAESKKAGNPTTAEFKQLAELRTMFPQFSIVVKSTRGSRDNYKGLNYKFMEEYIEAHDAERAVELTKTLYTMRGLNSDGSVNPILNAYSFGEIRMWFLETHPEIEEANSKTSENLAEIKRVRSERRVAA